MSDTLNHVEAGLCSEQIAAAQAALGLNDAAFVRKFPVLGSARTWRRMRLKDWSSLPLDVWLPRLREVAASIEPRGSLDSQPSALNSGSVPTAFVTRHLGEAEHCRRDGQLALARHHCRAARQAIEAYQRALA